jgi:subtilase-type serine protease
MNRTYRLVFNHALRVVQVASELTAGNRAGLRRAAAPAVLLRRAGLALALAGLCAGPASAATYTWGGTDGASWFLGSNWSGSTVPTSSDTLFMDNGNTVVIDGAAASSYDTRVGNTGTGSLLIENGGSLTDTTIFIGQAAGSSGTAVVTGAGSSWTTTSMGVGHSGTGSLTISDGATLTVTTYSSYVGAEATGIGTVTVTGAGSSWIGNNYLYIGNNGTATVLVEDGGSVSNGLDAYVGRHAGSNATVTVTGDGSSWTTGGNLYVGYNGTGSYTVTDGATTTINGDIVVGYGSAGIGTLTVSDGAVLQVGGGTNGISTGSGTATIVIDNATLRVINSALTSSAAMTLGSTVTIDTNGYGASLSGVLSGSGSLLKTGTGTLTLSGANTYTGGTTLQAGTLALGSSTALGADALTMADGTTLDLVGNGLSVANWITSTGTATINVGAGLSNTLKGDLDGGSDGLLVKTGSGTLVLTGDADYGNGTEVAAGTLQIGDGGTHGSITGDVLVDSGATLAVNRSDDIPFASTVSGEGSVVKLGSGTLTVLGENTYTGGTEVAAGTLQIGNGGTVGSIVGDVAIDSGATLAFNRSDDIAFAGVFSGEGTLEKDGDGVLTLTGDSSGFAGSTVVDSGTLAVDGTLGGTLSVLSGAILAGSGTVGSTTIEDGGVLSPGGAGSIATLTVDGDLSFASGASYLVDATSDGSSDLVDVTGTATLGGASTVAVASGSNWSTSTVYTILSAASGVSGTFGSLSSNFAFLDPSLSYDANNVYLTLARNDVSFASVGTTPNQQGTAAAVESLGEGNEVYDAVVELDASSAVSAFDSLSGQVYSASRLALLDDRFLQNGINQRLDGDVIGRHAGRFTAWLAGSGGRTSRDGDGNGVAADIRRQGTMVGVDGIVTPNLLVGAAVGNQDIRDALSSLESSTRTDATEWGLYAQARWNALSLRAGVLQADYDLRTSRQTVVGDTLSQWLGASYGARGTSAFVQAGWDFHFFDTLTLTPELGYTAVRLRTDGVTETGGSTALSVASSRDDYRYGTAALRALWDISGGQRDHAQLSARLGWQRASGDLAASSDLSFASGSTGFSVESAPLARDTGFAQVAVAISPTDASRVSLQATGRSGDGTHDVAAQLVWGLAF